MEFYEDDLELYKHVNFEDSMYVLMCYLIFLYIIKVYFRL